MRAEMEAEVNGKENEDVKEFKMLEKQQEMDDKEMGGPHGSTEMSASSETETEVQLDARHRHSPAAAFRSCSTSHAGFNKSPPRPRPSA